MIQILNDDAAKNLPEQTLVKNYNYQLLICT